MPGRKARTVKKKWLVLSQPAYDISITLAEPTPPSLSLTSKVTVYEPAPEYVCFTVSAA